MTGWPYQCSDVAPILQPYYSIRDELTTQDGLIFNGEQVVVPLGLRPSLKQSIYLIDFGIEGCLRRARECLFWPGIPADIRQYIGNCLRHPIRNNL